MTGCGKVRTIQRNPARYIPTMERLAEQTARDREPRRETPVFSRPLCAVDGKEGGYAAVRQAAALTGPGGELTLLLVTSFRTEGDRRAPAIGPTEAHEILKRAEAIAIEAGVSVRIEVDPATPPASVVLDWAAGHDLLAMGAPASSWLGGMFVAGVADATHRELPVAVLTAKPAAGEDLFRHTLIASDGLEDSAMPLAVAARVAAPSASRVTLLHAVGHRDPGEAPLLAQTEQLRSLGIPQPDLVILHGRAHEVIVDVAERLAASLIVQGSRRRSGPRALGSVSRHVIHEAGCSVLTVPPEASVSEAQQ